MLKVAFCPHCKGKLIIRINQEDVDHVSKKYPTPLYVLHNECNGFSTWWFDSIMNISYVSKGKEDASKWKFVNTIKV